MWDGFCLFKKKKGVKTLPPPVLQLPQTLKLIKNTDKELEEGRVHFSPAAFFSSAMVASSSWTLLMFLSLSSATKDTFIDRNGNTLSSTKTNKKWYLQGFSQTLSKLMWIYLCEQLFCFVLPYTALLLDLLCIMVSLSLQLCNGLHKLQQHTWKGKVDVNQTQLCSHN